MAMRGFFLAVTGFVISVAACSSSESNVFEVDPTPTPVASVAVIVPPSLTAGQTARASAITKDASGATLSGRAVKWVTSSASIASVTDSGMISAVAPGTAVLSATSEGVEGEASLDVVPPAPAPVASISVSINPSSILTGQTAQATAITLDANGAQLTGRTIAWQSSNSGVASVSAAGVVTAGSAGTATISASSEGKTGSSTVNVSAPAPIPVATVSVSPTSSSLLVGATTQLTATTRDANNNVLTGRVVTWSSANTAIARVSSAGLVTAVAAGTVSVTASSEGKAASSAITVAAPAPAPVATVSVSPSSSSLFVGNTTSLSATTRDANNNVLTGRVITWSSSATGIVSVNANSGVVTAVAVGSATITATSEGQSGTASISVAVPPPPGSSNEPAGMTLVKERSFNALQEDASWDTDNSLSIVQDASAPKSPSSVIRATYQAGFAGGSSPGHAGTVHNGARVLYISYWGRLSANFTGHLTSVNKQLYEWANGASPFYFEFGGVGSGTLTPQIVLQGTPTDGIYRPNLVPNASVTRGQWFHVEIVLTGNTSGTKNGSVDWWMDGVHVGSLSSLQFTSATTSWNTFEFRPVWGGVGDVVPSTMTVDWDHVYLSGKN